jgi:hypothetical protein
VISEARYQPPANFWASGGMPSGHLWTTYAFPNRALGWYCRKEETKRPSVHSDDAHLSCISSLVQPRMYSAP